MKTRPVVGWAGLGRITCQFTWEMGLGMELTMQLHSLVCVLAGASDRLNLNLHWLAHKVVKSELTPYKVSCGTTK